MHPSTVLHPHVPACAAVLGLLAVGAMAGRAQPSAEAFFQAPHDAGSELPVDQVYPRGRLFPFSFYSTGGGSTEKRGELLPAEEVQAGLRRVREHGVTMIGPQYELNHRVLADARAHGMRAIYSIGMSKDEVRGGQLTEEQIVEAIRAQVLAVADDENLAWWDLRPEELRHWRRSEIEYLEIAARTVRETDPLRRPIYFYDPGHRSAAGLSHTARHLDFVAKGMYTNYSGMKDQRVWCRWSIEQEIEAARSTNPDALPLAVPEMFRQPADEELHLIPAWVRHDAYCALVAGAKGMVVFSASQRANFDAHESYFSEWLHVSRELCGEPGLGQVFLFGERREELQVRILEGPATVEMLFPAGGVREPMTYPSVSWADLAYGGRRYLFAVNSSPETVVAEFAGFPVEGIRAEDLFGDDAPELADGRLRAALGAWGVRAFLFSPLP